jgi:hypothetical protein
MLGYSGARSIVGLTRGLWTTQRVHEVGSVTLFLPETAKDARGFFNEDRVESGFVFSSLPGLELFTWGGELICLRKRSTRCNDHFGQCNSEQ